MQRVFIGQHDRTIDPKNRVQLPSPFRSAIDPDRDGAGLYVTLGDDPGTLSLYTERVFEEFTGRIETEFMDDEESLQFEREFYAYAYHIDLDKQGRFVIPDRLRQIARLGDEIYLVGRKFRIDVWNRVDFDRSVTIDPSGQTWHKWRRFTRMRPSGSKE